MRRLTKASSVRALVFCALTPFLSSCGGGSSGGGASNTSASGSSSTSSPAPLTDSGNGPAITLQPQPQTVTLGQRAFFTVAATGATQYQWYKNRAAIAGATSASYFAEPAASSDANAQFLVAASDKAGTSVSVPALLSINPNTDGSPPDSFWGNPASLPAATQVMTFAFLNQTQGHYPDSQIFWSITGTSASGAAINELHSIADAPTYDMPGISSARMYFYIAPNAASATQSATSYYDFIEFNLGRASSSVPWNFNGDTTRVDAFGIKLAIHLQCADGTDVVRGEDYGTFLEERSITFQKYLASVPAEFQSTATQFAPYRIVEPGTAANFQAAGANANYYNNYIDTVWSANGINPALVPKPTPFLKFANGSLPDLIAAVERHVADKPGTFNANGTLVNPNFWSTASEASFYAAAPANYYAQFWHTHAIAQLAYGFSYDDVGSHSSDIGCDSPTRLVVAVGW